MEIQNYRVALFNHNVVYSDLGRCWTTAQIRVQADNMTAWIVFYDPERTPTVPTNRYADSGGGQMTIFLPKDQYVPHVDLLRNEHPIYLVERSGDWRRGSLRTANEDVGEGEEA